MKEFVISQKEQNQRIDKFVRKVLDNAPLSFIYKIFRKKDVKANGHWVDISYVIKENDVIRIYISDEQLADFSKPRPIVASKFNAEIIYEDENILVINKNKGILVHGCESEKCMTLSNQVLNYLYSKGEYDPSSKGFTPSPAHRIDRNTSGVVMFAKNLPSLQALELLFKDKEGLEKHYIALVCGEVTKNGEVNAPLLKDADSGLVKVASIKNGAKSALTRYVLIENIKSYSLLDVSILTGRTHQIRVHMSYIGHPIVGDAKYGDFKANRLFKEQFKLDSQFLHASKVKITYAPSPLAYLDGKEFIAKLPNKLDAILKQLKSL